MSPLKALLYCLPVLLGIEKELRLPYDAIGAAKPVEEVKYINDLLYRIRRSCLLAVPECGVGYPVLLREVDRQ